MLDRIMSVKLEVDGVIMIVVRDYVPKIGSEMDKKEKFLI